MERSSGEKPSGRRSDGGSNWGRAKGAGEKKSEKKEEENREGNKKSADPDDDKPLLGDAQAENVVRVTTSLRDYLDGDDQRDAVVSR